jgi:hypothetical protein
MYLCKLASRSFDFEETSTSMTTYMEASSSLRTFDIIGTTAVSIFDKFTTEGQDRAIRMLIAEYSTIDKACESVGLQDKLKHFKTTFSIKDVAAPLFLTSNASMQARNLQFVTLRVMTRTTILGISQKPGPTMLGGVGEVRELVVQLIDSVRISSRML